MMIANTRSVPLGCARAIPHTPGRAELSGTLKGSVNYRCRHAPAPCPIVRFLRFVKAGRDRAFQLQRHEDLRSNRKLETSVSARRLATSLDLARDHSEQLTGERHDVLLRVPTRAELA